MSGQLLPFIFGYLFGRAQGGFHLFGGGSDDKDKGGGLFGGGLFGSSYKPPLPGMPAHHAHPAPIHIEEKPPHGIPASLPSATSTAIHWTSNAPAGLPPFPSGWKAMAPPPPDVVSRSWQLMATLPYNETKYEPRGSGWVAYHASREGTKKFVTAWEPKGSVVPATVVPVMTHVQPAPGVTVPVVTPVVVQHPAVTHPTIQRGDGARSGKADAVRLWQHRAGITPDDGEFGPHTEALTRAWQLHHGLKDDGIVGPLTWGASETAAA